MKQRISISKAVLGVLVFLGLTLGYQVASQAAPASTTDYSRVMAKEGLPISVAVLQSGGGSRCEGEQKIEGPGGHYVTPSGFCVEEACIKAGRNVFTASCRSVDVQFPAADHWGWRRPPFRLGVQAMDTGTGNHYR